MTKSEEKSLSTNHIQQVLLIESDENARILVKDTLKSIGFGQVTMGYDIPNALQILANEPGPDWVICCANTKEKHTFFDVVVAMLHSPKFKNTRLSILLEENERECIPVGFELGLTSFHFKPFTKTSLQNEFDTLIKQINDNSDTTAHIAAKRLFEYLETVEDFENQIQLSKSLIASFPGRSEYILKLSEGHFMAGNTEEAKKSLWQAKHLGGDVEFAANQLADLIFNGETDEHNEQGFAACFNIQQTYLLDKDEASRSQILLALQKLGITEVSIFEDGNELLAALNPQSPPQLILTEWKCGSITGSALVQKIRQKQVLDVPIVVVSSLVGPKDRILLDEIGVNHVVNKPIQNESFIATIMNAISQEQCPTELAAIETKFRSKLADGNLIQAKELMDQLTKNSDLPREKMNLVQAEWHYANKDLSEARRYAVEALRLDGNSIFVLNILGKILLDSGDNESACKVFEKANSLSPQNIERLCSLAEVAAISDNSELAQSSVAAAKSVDQDNERVLIADTSVKLLAGDVSKAKTNMESLGTLNRVISVMNNKAVSHVRAGNLDAALKLYEDALAALPPDEKTLKYTIIYNTSLSLVKKSMYKEALEYLNRISVDAPPHIYKKSNALNKKVNHAINTKSTITLNSDQKTLSALNKTGGDYFEMPIALHINPGEYGLHLIFHAKGNQERWKTLIKQAINNISKTPFRKGA